MIGDVYHWCDQFEYTQPNGLAYSSGFGCHSNHGYITPVSVNKIYSSDINNICVILRNGESGTYGYFYSGANNGATPSNMTDSNAQLWDNGISAIGTWINSLRNKIGVQLHI